ncbi:MAG: hypothetical protein ABFS41_04075 [Myxococcota bacterium]
MADGRPHLVAVGDPKPTDAPAAAPEPDVAASRTSRLPLVLLAVALAVCAFGWIQSRSEADRLSTELTASQQALAAANERIAAEETRRAAVQGHVSELRTDAAAFAGRLAELEALVAADLAPAADAQVIGNEAPAAD